MQNLQNYFQYQRKKQATNEKQASISLSEISKIMLMTLKC